MYTRRTPEYILSFLCFCSPLGVLLPVSVVCRSLATTVSPRHCSCGLPCIRFQGVPPSSALGFLLAYWYFDGMYVRCRSRDLVYQWTAIYLVTPPPILLSFRPDAPTSLSSTYVSHSIFTFYQSHHLNSLQLYLFIVAHYELGCSCLGLRLLEILIQNTSKITMSTGDAHRYVLSSLSSCFVPYDTSYSFIS